MLNLLRRGTGFRALWRKPSPGFHQQGQPVEMAVPRQHALVVGTQFRVLQDELFDLRRKHVDAAHDHHVVAAAGDFFHAAHAARRARQQASEVTGAVADDGQRFLGQRGEDQLAQFTIGQQRASLRIDDLRVEVVLPDRRTILGFDAFARYTRPHHLTQTIDVDRLQARALLDRAAHVVGPGFGAEDAGPQRRRSRVHPLALHFVGDGQHVTGRDHDDVGPEILDQLHLALGLAAAKGHDRQAQFFGAVMCAQAAGKEAVAVAHMHHVTRPGARRADAAGHAVGPGVDVVAGVADYRRLAGGAAGRMDASALGPRHGKHAKRVAVAQILFGRERELRQVLQRVAIVRMDPGLIELGAVDRRMGVGMAQRGLQAFELQCAQFVLRGFFNWFKRKGMHGQPQTIWPCICADLPLKSAITSPLWLVTRIS